jgi:hypothetical protein
MMRSFGISKPMRFSPPTVLNGGTSHMATYVAQANHDRDRRAKEAKK